ncbi:MAG: AAA family ATPase [Desulfobacterales bacterium]|nr:AAA family ATPase [Desulfobacterales bacterium]
MFNRSILHKLVEWKNKPDRKPLVLRGARQVGKTTAVEIFSRHFENYIYLNLEIPEDRNIFKNELAISELFQAILVIKNVILRKGSILLFIDEIQNSPFAVKMLRYFYEQKKEVHVIAAGSLLEIMLDREDISFPVGRIEYLYLYPLSFREFLEAGKESQILKIYDTIPYKSFTHKKLLNLFHEYTLIGGMPEIIKKYIESGAVTSLKSVYESLMMSYINDSEKYARNHTMRYVLRHCLEAIPFEAGNRIKFQGFGKSNYKSREVGEALRVLERAMLIYILYPTTSTELPSMPDHRKSPKLQYIDTGLINYFAGLQQNYFKYGDLHAFYRGLIAEHIVRQEIIAGDMETNRKPVFWVRDKKQSGSEVDVVQIYKNCCVPVEIKAGKTGTLKSLHQFINNTPHSFAVRLYAGDMKIDNAETFEGKKFRLLNLPYFLAGKLMEYVEHYI